jgi:hypothetical protein
MERRKQTTKSSYSKIWVSILKIDEKKNLKPFKNVLTLLLEDTTTKNEQVIDLFPKAGAQQTT